MERNGFALISRLALAGALASSVLVPVALARRVQDEDCFERLRDALSATAWTDAPVEGVEALLAAELAPGSPCEASAALGAAIKARAATELRAASADADLQREWELVELASLGAVLQGNLNSAAHWRTRAAQVFREHGQYTRAAEVLEAALARFSDAEGARAQLWIHLAEARRLLGETQRAWETLDIAESSLLEGERGEFYATMISGLRAQIYADLGLSDLARPWAVRALALADAMLAKTGVDIGADAREELVAAARERVIVVEAALGNHEEAVRLADAYLRDAELYDANRAARAQLEVLRARSRVFLALQGDASSEEAEREVRALLARTDLRAIHRLDASLLLARTLRARGEHALAREAFDARPDVAELPLKERADVATTAALLALAEGADDATLAAAHADVDAALDALIAAWESAPRRPGGVAFLRYASRRSLIDAWIQIAIARFGEEAGAARALERLAAVQQLGSLAHGDPSTPLTIETMRERLCAAERGLLVYYVASERTHVFAVDRDRIVHVQSEGRFAFDDPWDAWSRALDPTEFEASPREALAREREQAERLAAILLPPEIQERIALWTELSIVGADLMDGLPIEWLPWRGGPHLVLDVAVATLPSLPVGVMLAGSDESATPRTRDVLLLAAPEVDEDVARAWRLEPLALHGGLVRSLRECYGEERVDARTGADASIDVLASPALHDAAVLHVIGHSIVDASRERPAALVLAPARATEGLVLAGDGAVDGLAWCEGVERFRAPPVVLLTTCRSGAASPRRGDANAADLAGAWIRAGARTVLVTQRPLQLSRAVELSSEIHRGFAQGASFAIALQLALRAVAEREPDGALPFLHGLPRVVGWAHAPVVAPARAHATAELPAADGARAATPSTTERSTTGWRLWAAAAVVALAVLAGAINRRSASRGPADPESPPGRASR